MSELAIVKSELALLELGAKIKHEHHKAQEAAGDAMRRALNVGRMLLEAKGRLKHGEWLPWLQGNCELSERTAQRYIQVVKKCGTLQLDTTAITHLPVSRLLTAIANNDKPENVKNGNVADLPEREMSTTVDKSLQPDNETRETMTYNVQLGEFETLQAMTETARTIPELQLLIEIGIKLQVKIQQTRNNAEKALDILMGRTPTTNNEPPPPNESEYEEMQSWVNQSDSYGE